MKLGRGAYHRVQAAIVDLHMQGLSHRKIAKELDIHATTVARHLHDVKEQVMALEPMQRLKKVAVPLAVDNLIEGLKNGDKEYTLETLKGTSLLVTHNKHEGLPAGGAMNFALQVVVEQPPAGRGQTVEALIGNVAGIPRQINTSEAVVDAEHVTEAA